MISTAICLTAMMGQNATPKVKMQNLKQHTFLIFMRGSGADNFTADELTKMQEGHIANLTRLYKEKKSPVAGPFGSRGDMRGIVILNLPKKEVPKEFENDPFVKNGLLKIELHDWVCDSTVFAWPESDLGMTTYVLGIAKKGESWSEKQGSELQASHLGTIASLMEKGDLYAAGPITGHDTWRGFYIFPAEGEIDNKAIEARVASDPMFKTKHLELELHPLWLGKGLFRKPQ